MRVVPDTNVWIAWFGQAPEDFALEGGRSRPFLATVTLQELWAGTRNPAERAYVERVHTLAWRQRRLLNPPTGAWILSGQALEVLARRGGIGPGRLRDLRNDVLLAATAFVYDAAVMTRDRRDFQRIAEVLPVRVVSPSVRDLRGSARGQ